MKLFGMLLLSTFPVFAQSFHFGVTGGVPLNEYFRTGSIKQLGSDTYVSDTKHYTFGPTVELRLPWRLGVQADLLYKRLNFDEARSLPGASTNSSTTANSWEVPVTGKYRFPHPRVAAPYVRAGASFRKITGVRQNSLVHMVTYPPSTLTTSTDAPSELRNTSTTGLVLGAGLDLKLLFLHLTPELRYTRWGANLFENSNGLLSSRRNQTELLVGIIW
jgi:hypothetical protein